MGGHHCLMKNMRGIPQLHVMLNILLKNWHVIDALTKGHWIHSSVHWIFHDAVGNKKVSAWWVPKELTEQHKAQETGISLNNLLCLLGRTILVFSLVMKHWSTAIHQKEKKLEDRQLQKFKVSTYAQKVLETTLWGRKQILLLSFTNEKQLMLTITSIVYSDYGKPFIKNQLEFCEKIWRNQKNRVGNSVPRIS